MADATADLAATAAETTLTATCLCGECSFTATVKPGEVLPEDHYLCHCDSCRHATGAFATQSANWPGPLSPSANKALTTYAFGKSNLFHFCPKCGSTLFLADAVGGDVSAASGSIGSAAAHRVAYSSHQFLGDTRDGGLSVWLPRIQGKELTRWWGAMDTGEPLEGWTGELEGGKKRSENSLSAYCHCKGVSFLITPPDPRSAENPYVDPANAKISRGAWWLDKDAKRFLAGFCACTSCRLASGPSDAFPWAFIPACNLLAPSKEPYSLDGAVSAAKAGNGTLCVYRSSDRAERFFCGTCGAVVFYRTDERPGLLHVAVGILDAAEGARAEGWLGWWTGGVSFAADAAHVGYLEGLKEGLAKWEGR